MANLAADNVITSDLCLDNINGQAGGSDKKISAAYEPTTADFIELLKPRVMSLAIFTAFVGLIRATDQIHPFLAVVAILCIAIGAGSAGALNMWYDSDIDRVMKRTATRPIPSRRIARETALLFGLILAIFAVMMLGLSTNFMAAFLLAFTIFFYVVIYSVWLKRRTVQNIVIGGVAGALPPVVGWAAVTGSLSYESMLLFAIIFLWTPPHFWALCLFTGNDYQKAGIPMLSVVKGERVTRINILIYSCLLAALAVLPTVFNLAGMIYGIIATVAGIWFIVLAIMVYRKAGADNYRQEKRLFTYSIFYLFTLFAILGLEKFIF